MLPDIIADYAWDEAERLGVNPEMIAFPALAVCAAALDDGWTIQPKLHDTTWKESARLWIGVCSPPGTKKTPAFNRALAPLRALEKQYHEKAVEPMKQYQYALKEWQNNQRRENPDPMIEEPEKPITKRKLIHDATVEALSMILADNPGGILCHQDELAGWLESFGAYKAGSSGKERANWLMLYNGGYHTVDRITRGHLAIPNWSASLVGGIQPDRIKSLAQKNALTDDGLLQRLFVVYGEKTGMGQDRPPDYKARDRYFDTVKALAALGVPGDEAIIRVSPEAFQVRTDIEKMADFHATMPWANPALQGHLDKYGGLCARLMLLYHMIEHVGGSIPAQVSAATAMRVGQLIARYLFDKALRFYLGTVGAGSEATHGRWVAKHLLAHLTERFTFRDIYRAYPAERRDKDGLLKALEALELAGWTAPEMRRRRDSVTWQVNPKIHSDSRWSEKAGERRREAEKTRAKFLKSCEALGLNAEERMDCYW